MSLLRNPALLAAAFGHLSVDMYAGMLPLLLLVLKDPLNLSYSQVGLVSMGFSLTSSIGQPFFGWLGDRESGRLLAVLGIAGIAITMGTMRIADNFAILLVMAPIAGLGSAAFHPQGAALASRTTARTRGTSMSIFMLGGNTGYAFGPVIGNALFALAGGFMPQTMAVIGLAQAAIVYWALSQQHPVQDISTPAPVPAPTTRAATGVIITLALIIFLRSWVQTSVSTFIPQVIKAQGFSDEFASAVLFSILMPLAIGTVVGGILSDRIGHRPILIISTALIGPSLWGVLTFGQAGAFAWGALLGISIGASLPVTLVMAQGFVPRGLGMMSGFVLGFTFIAGAFGASINGIIADHIGLLPTLLMNAVLPLGATALSFLIPGDKPAPAAVAEQAVVGK